MAEQSKQNGFWQEKLFLPVFFLISYAIIWAIGKFAFNADIFSFSPMHWLVPIAAFFLSFWAFDWMEEYFEIRLSWWFPILVIIIGLLAFFVNGWFYYCNAFTDLSSQGATSLGCDSAGSQKSMQHLGANGWTVLGQDAFLYFLMAILLGWLSRVFWIQAMHPASAPVLKPKKK